MRIGENASHYPQETTHSRILTRLSPKSLGGVIGASLSAFGAHIFKDSLDSSLKPYLNTYSPYIGASRTPCMQALSSYLAPSLSIIIGFSLGVGIQIIIQRCLKETEKAQIPTEPKIAAIEPLPPSEAAVRSVSMLTEEQMRKKSILAWLETITPTYNVEMSQQIDQALNFLDGLIENPLENPPELDKLIVIDPENSLINKINTLITTLNVDTPEIQEKLFYLVSCGHPELNTHAIEILTNKLDNTGECRRKVIDHLTISRSNAFENLRQYFEKIPNILNPTSAAAASETFDLLIKRLSPAQIAFLPYSPKFWAVMQDRNTANLRRALPVACLEVLVNYLKKDKDKNQNITVINDILCSLDDNDPDLEAKLKVFAGCEHRGLRAAHLMAKAKQLKFKKIRELIDTGIPKDEAIKQVQIEQKIQTIRNKALKEWKQEILSASSTCSGHEKSDLT